MAELRLDPLLEHAYYTRPIAADLYLSWPDYMGSTSSGDLNYNGHCFCGYRQNNISCLRVGTACSSRCCIASMCGTFTRASKGPRKLGI
ncbi:uncharacterized protein ALTATR162_LOCUS2187 [Alternaria atra]|uniref:Uncharacterized protein n=1 Tax=Alternaria atra TaxID=119953 RepID=A0A8J2HV41_9PLEO|nr:uncharacterized protein ALTATR162_LOCUS2187 [Alternaria atra]CAG5148346.1 unnamed protein product [Alternaria atra]